VLANFFKCKGCEIYKAQVDDYKALLAEADKRAEIARLSLMSTVDTLLTELNSKKGLRIVESIETVKEPPPINPMDFLGVFQDRGDPAIPERNYVRK